MVLVLGLSKAELSHGEFNEAILIRFKAMPLHEDIEDSHSVGQSGFKVIPDSMPYFFEMTDGGEHGEHCLNDHTLIPYPARTDLHVDWITRFGVKGSVGENDHLFFKLFNQRLEGGIIDIGHIGSPVHHQSILVEYKTELSSNNPPVIGFALPAYLLWASSLTDWMDEFNPIGIGYSKGGGVS